MPLSTRTQVQWHKRFHKGHPTTAKWLHASPTGIARRRPASLLGLGERCLLAVGGGLSVGAGRWAGGCLLHLTCSPKKVVLAAGNRDLLPFFFLHPCPSPHPVACQAMHRVCSASFTTSVFLHFLPQSACLKQRYSYTVLRFRAILHQPHQFMVHLLCGAYVPPSYERTRGRCSR